HQLRFRSFRSPCSNFVIEAGVKPVQIPIGRAPASEFMGDFLEQGLRRPSPIMFDVGEMWCGYAYAFGEPPESLSGSHTQATNLTSKSRTLTLHTAMLAYLANGSNPILADQAPLPTHRALSGVLD